MEEVAAMMREWANVHARKADELRLLAFKILEPPEGVRVEVAHMRGSCDVRVTFVGPLVELSKSDAA